MGDLAHRVNVGEKFSEGARLLWLGLEASGWSREELRKALNVSSGGVSRWLYGDRRPCHAQALRLQELFEIPVATWRCAPREPFVPPALRVPKGSAEEQARHRAALREAFQIALAMVAANDKAAELGATG